MKKIIISSNKVITVNSKALYIEDGNLPSGYTKLQYVTLNQATIDTGEKTKQTTVIESKVYTNSSTATYFWLSDSSSSGTTNTTAYYSSSGNWRFDGKTQTIASATIKGGVHEFIQNKDGVWMDGTKVVTYSSVSTFTSSANLKFGASANNNVRHYYFRHYKDGVLVSNYIPCTNPDNVAGFYDLVKEEFKEGGTAGPAAT